MDAAAVQADPTVWKDVTLLLLGATADHAVSCGGTAAEDFRQMVRDSIGTLQKSSSNSQVLMSAGALSQAISHYSKQTQKKVDTLLGDVGAIMNLFVEHLNVVHAGADTRDSLAAIRAAIKAGVEEANLHRALEPTGQALSALAQNGDARQAEIKTLQNRIAQLEQSPTAPRLPAAATQATYATVDGTTGLPVRSEAEGALRRAIETEAHSYAAVFYLHRMALTNARFGESIGNQVILFCSQHIASLVARNNDALFRWSGPAFVAVLDRDESEISVAAEVQRLVGNPLSRFFETSARSVYLPVKVTGSVIPLFNTSYDDAIERLQTFILNASGQASGD
jgi:GGDEF domain-containing protein